MSNEIKKTAKFLFQTISRVGMNLLQKRTATFMIYSTSLNHGWLHKHIQVNMTTVAAVKGLDENKLIPLELANGHNLPAIPEVHKSYLLA